MASRVASFLGTVQLRLKIEQATSTEDDPTPIYLLDEVVQDIGSTSKNVIDAVDIIEQRLQHRSPTVKQKALKLVKHAAQRGSPELRRALARHSSSVRDLTHFKCAPDAFKGDIPWKRVQEYAREALDTLHAAPGTQTTSSFTSTGLGGGGVGGSGKRMQGFGSDGNGSGSGGATSSGMMGFGSDSVGYQYGKSGFNDGGGSTASYRAPLSGGTGIDFSSGGAVLESLSYGMKDLTDRAVGALTRPQHDRLNSVDSEDDGHGYGIQSSSTSLGGGGGGGGGGGSRAPVMLDRSPDPYNNGGLGVSSSSSSQQLSRESRLVDRICTPSGMRAAPSSEDLNKFVEAAVAFDGAELATALQHKLEIGSWQETLRALCAIEALLEKNSSSSASTTAGEVAVHFQLHVGVIRRAQQSTQATVRQRAQRVLKLLGADTLPEEGLGSSSAAKPAALTGPPQDLLGGDLLLESTEGAGFISNAPINNNSTSNANALDLLAGLDVASEPSTGDVFGDWADSTAAGGGVAGAPAAAPAPVAAGGLDLLDALTDLTLAPQPSTAGPTPAAMNTAGPLDDFFSMSSPAGGGVSFPNGGGANAQLQYQPSPTNTFTSGSFMSTGGGFVAPLTGPQQQHQQLPPRTASLGSGGGGSGMNDDVLRAINAATSGITSTKREEVAFDFVTTAMAQLKSKK